ncbi:hypothetical protein CIB48_g8573 [Xylaria polymorpha]|nr:hypothetical protein CIB48_g8573 [Xylaria polymorpha]
MAWVAARAYAAKWGLGIGISNVIRSLLPSPSSRGCKSLLGNTVRRAGDDDDGSPRRRKAIEPGHGGKGKGNGGPGVTHLLAAGLRDWLLQLYETSRTPGSNEASDCLAATCVQSLDLAAVLAIG